jgi:hypothetical protein
MGEKIEYSWRWGMLKSIAFDFTAAGTLIYYCV